MKMKKTPLKILIDEMDDGTKSYKKRALKLIV